MEAKIFAALARLRIRKCRPDLERILGVLRKDGRYERDFVFDVLEGMTDKHLVLRVEYKGSISYRDCRNWAKLNGINFENEFSYCNAVILNSSRVSSAIRNVVSRISETATVATLDDLKAYFRENPHEFTTNSSVVVAVRRELNAGNLRAVGGDGLIVGPKRSRMTITSAECSSSLDGKRMKKVKKIFDPSDFNIGSNYQNTSSNSIVHAVITTKCEMPAKPDNLVCKLCSSSDKRRVMLVCVLCNVPFHLQCLGYSKQLSAVIQAKPWICMDCRTCIMCKRIGGELIFCDYCDEAYHMKCHQPPVRKQPLGEWICTGCRGKPAGRGRPPKHPWLATSLSKQRASPGDKAAFVGESCSDAVSTAASLVHSAPCMNDKWYSCGQNQPSDQHIPDVSKWSTVDVVAFFSSCGLGCHGDSLRRHDIDGAALLSLTRHDVLSTLGVKLGPALKILNYVKLFQTRRLDSLDFYYL